MHDSRGWQAGQYTHVKEWNGCRQLKADEPRSGAVIWDFEPSLGDAGALEY